MNQIKNGNKNKNIELYKLGFAFFLIQFQFWFPIWVIFLLDRGISFLEVIIADVVYNSAVIFFEFPLGMLGDRLGRKKSYSLGAIIWAITFITMILTHNFYILLLCWIFWAMALAMISGTDKAYIYEMIVQTGNLDKSSYIFGYFTSIQNLAFLISHFLAGYLYEINSNLPIFLNAILYLIAVLIVLTIPRIQNQKSTVKTEIQPSLKQAITTTKKILNKKIIRNIVIVMGVLLMYFWTVTLIFQPLLIYLGFNVDSFGFIFVIFTGLGIIGGLLTGPLVVKYGKKKIVSFCIFSCLLSMGFIGIAPGAFLTIVGVMLLSFFYYIADSVLKLILNENLKNEYRASIISSSNFISSLLLIISRPLVGSFSSIWNAKFSFVLWFMIGIPMMISLLYLIKTSDIKS